MEELNKFALSAVECDRLGQTEEAIFYYKKAAHCTICLIESGKLSETYKQAVEKYLLRARLLMHNNGVNAPDNSFSDIILKAQKMIDTALGQDELGEEEEAVRLYAETAEFCIEKSKLNDENSVKMRSLAFLALDRAEALKNKLAGKGTEQFLFAGPSAPNLTDEDEDNNNTMCLLTLHSSDSPSPSNAGRIVANASPQPAGKTRRRWSEVRDGGSRKAVEKLEEGEVRVLFATSRINTRTYVPFIKECDLKEPFALSIPFSDKDGFLPLSEKQKKVLKGWLRPDEFMADPKVIVRIDSGTIKQTIITDCSFVASLAVCARFENRFGTRLITNIIYPQNKKGDPIHNPCGKYMVKLHINGIWRKVIIDDLLPLGNNGELLCSHSQNKNELWVSLLEKAYMKMMGGYDLPGSNSVNEWGFSFSNKSLAVMANLESSQWLKACMDGNLDTVKSFLENGQDIEIADTDGATGLIFASMFGEATIVDFLLSNGARFDRVVREGYSALYYAAMEGHLLVCERLVASGAKVNQKTDDGRSPWLIACGAGYLDIVEFFVSEGQNIGDTDNNGLDALMYGSRTGDVDLASFLLSKGARIEQTTNAGYSALYFAAQRGHLAMCEFLVAKGAKVNQKSNNGRSAWLIACAAGYLDIVEFFMDIDDLDIELMDNNGLTALMYGSRAGHVQIVSKLLSEGAWIGQTTNAGYSALHFAARRVFKQKPRMMVNGGTVLHRHESKKDMYKTNDLHLAVVGPNPKSPIVSGTRTSRASLQPNDNSTEELDSSSEREEVIHDKEFLKERKNETLNWDTNEPDSARVEQQKDPRGDAPYTVTVITGNRWAADTEANLYINRHGSNMDSEKLWLKQEFTDWLHSSDKRQRFRQNQSDSFAFRLSSRLGIINRITVGHERRGYGAGVFIGRILVTEDEVGGDGEEPMDDEHNAMFLCNRWFDSGQVDGRLERSVWLSAFYMISSIPVDGRVTRGRWEFVLHGGTNDGRGGTTAQLVITGFGTDGQATTGGLYDTQKATAPSEALMQLDFGDIGELLKIRLEIDGTGPSPDYFLNLVEFKDLDTDERFVVMCGKWLRWRSAKKGDQPFRELLAFHIGVEPLPLITYDGNRAFRSALSCFSAEQLCVELYGDFGDTGHVLIHVDAIGGEASVPEDVEKAEENDGRAAERTVAVDVPFKLEAVNVGRVSGVRVHFEPNAMEEQIFEGLITLQNIFQKQNVWPLTANSSFVLSQIRLHESTHTPYRYVLNRSHLRERVVDQQQQTTTSLAKELLTTKMEGISTRLSKRKSQAKSVPSRWLLQMSVAEGSTILAEVMLCGEKRSIVMTPVDNSLTDGILSFQLDNSTDFDDPFIKIRILSDGQTLLLAGTDQQQPANAENKAGGSDELLFTYVDKVRICDNLDIVELFMEEGQNIEATDFYGCTALTYACTKGMADVVHFWLLKGARSDRSSSSGKTALDEAVANGHQEVVELLFSHGSAN